MKKKKKKKDQFQLKILLMYSFIFYGTFVYLNEGGFITILLTVQRLTYQLD